jgi:DNA (cytosine-5)-methyltransferase 1
MLTMRHHKPKLLDLYCCAGGAGMGYSRAGFDVVGVDIKPQPNYPFEFHQADALEYLVEHGHEFNAIHASPPCQLYTRMNQGLLQSMGTNKEHPDLVEPTRRLLKSTGLPYVMENVEGAPLLDPVTLCGSSFGLLVQRHRLFESNVFLMTMPCAHGWQKADKPPLHGLHGHRKALFSRVVGVYGHGRGKGDDWAAWSIAMGIDWMTRKEMTQAIPPAYTEFIGRQLMNVLLYEQVQ